MAAAIQAEQPEPKQRRMGAILRSKRPNSPMRLLDLTAGDKPDILLSKRWICSASCSATAGMAGVYTPASHHPTPDWSQEDEATFHSIG